MDKTLLSGIKENVVSDFYLTPDYFEIDLATLHGSGFSIQPKFSQSAYFRFHNQSEIFKNLYFSYLWRSLQQEANMRRLRFIKTKIDVILREGENGSPFTNLIGNKWISSAILFK